MRVEDNGLSCSDLDPQDALLLARAARDVVSAEYRTAKLRIKECELLLETLKDAAKQAHATWRDANDQIGTILDVFRLQGVCVDLPYPLLIPPLRHSSDSDSVDSDPSDA
jgi:hypothetical protein